MSNKLITMHQVRLIIHYLKRGLSDRKISKELGLSRNTVRSYTDRLESSSYALDQLQKLNDTALAEVVYPSVEKLAKDPRRANFTEQIPYWIAELKGTANKLNHQNQPK